MRAKNFVMRRRPLRFAAALLTVGAAALVVALLSNGSARHTPALAVAPSLGVLAADRESLELESPSELENYWHARVTYPTGKLDQRWVQKALEQDKRVPRGVPAGARRVSGGDSTNALALSTSAFTFLGPQPQESDPAVCNGLCFSFGRVAGRVSAIALDPTTTTPGLMTAYFAADGGGIWKSTNCCTTATTWAPTTDGSTVSTTHVDDIFVDPTNRWVYVATGDLSFGSLAFGSSGILRSKNVATSATPTWEVLGANVFTPRLAPTPPPDAFPQYQSISKVRVDPNNDQTIVAGTKTGLFFSYDQGATWKGPCVTNPYGTQRQDVTDLLALDAGTAAVQGEQTRLIVAIGTRGFATFVQPNLGKNGANGLYGTVMPTSDPGGDGCPAVASWQAQTTGWPAGTASGVPCDPPTTAVEPDSDNPDNSPAPCPANTNKIGRIELAAAPSTLNDGNPANDVIYAEVQAVDVHGPEAAHGGVPCGVLQRVPLVSSPGRARGCFFGLFRTGNGGQTWSQPGTPSDLYNLATAGPCGEDTPQNWYNEGLAVDPTNPNVLFMDTIDIWKSTNGGDTLVDISCGYYTGLVNNPVHVDNHVLLYAPPVSGVANTMLAGNDGGIYVSTNASNVPDPAAPGLGNPPTFTEINNTVGTIEHYSGDISSNFAGSANPVIVAGAQDNGSSSFQWPGFPTIGCPPCNWQQRIGGDGMFARIEAKLGQRVYMESQYGNVRVSQTGHAGVYSGTVPLVATSPSWPWNNEARSFVFPYELDKFDCAHNNPSTTTCDHIIAGSYRVYESVTTGGVAPAGSAAGWYVASPNLTRGTLGTQCFDGPPKPSDCRSYVNALSYAPQDNRVAIAGTNDGYVQYGFNMGTGAAFGQPNGATWVNVSGNNAVLPNRPILDVAIDFTNPLAGYAAVGGFNENTPTTPGHVFKVTCSASCASFIWEDKTGNLPNVPADAIIGSPKIPGQVFVGTDFGVYFTNNINAGTPLWTRLQNGIPNTMVWDFAIDRGTGADPITSATTLAAFTRGRGAYALLLPSVPTAVKIASFGGRQAGRSQVALSWRTGSEVDVLGFDVWRVRDGKRVKVNRALVAAKSAGPRGASYRLRDRLVRPGSYLYQLRIVKTSGARVWSSTAAVRVRR